MFFDIDFTPLVRFGTFPALSLSEGGTYVFVIVYVPYAAAARHAPPLGQFLVILLVAVCEVVPMFAAILVI